MNAVEKVKYVAELAKEVVIENNIECDVISLDEHSIFDLLSNSVVEEFDKVNNLEHKELILLATIL